MSNYQIEQLHPGVRKLREQARAHAAREFADESKDSQESAALVDLTFALALELVDQFPMPNREQAFGTVVHQLLTTIRLAEGDLAAARLADTLQKSAGQ